MREIYVVAKFAGRSITVCEEYYSKPDVCKKFKELKEIELAVKMGRGWERRLLNVANQWVEDISSYVFLEKKASHEVSFSQIFSDSLINSTASSIPKDL